METIIPFIICYDRLTDRKPESHSQRLDSISDIEGRIEVGIAGISTTAMEISCGSDSDISASRTGFACVGRVYLGNNNASINGFVFHEGLQLCESPVMQLPIESPTLVTADMLYLFHSENIAMLKPLNNFLAYLMVCASHEPCPSARESSEMSLGGFRAFALQGSYEPLVLSHLRDDTAVESAIRRNGKVLNSDINAQNSLMSSRAKRHVNVFGKTKMKKYSVLFVYSQYTFRDFPSIIFDSVFWHFYWEFLATMNSGNTQDALLIGETSWRIVFHKSSLDSRLGLCLLDHATGLFDTCTGKLGMKTERTNMFVDERLESISIFDFVLPSSIYAILKCVAIDKNGFAYRFIIRQFQTDYSTRHNHIYGKEDYLNAMLSLRERQFLPPINDVGFLASASW